MDGVPWFVVVINWLACGVNIAIAVWSLRCWWRESKVRREPLPVVPEVMAREISNRVMGHLGAGADFLDQIITDLNWLHERWPCSGCPACTSTLPQLRQLAARIRSVNVEMGPM